MKYRLLVFSCVVLFSACDQIPQSTTKNQQNKEISTAELEEEPEIESKVKIVEEIEAAGPITKEDILETAPPTEKDIVESLGFSNPDKALNRATPLNGGDTGERFCLNLNTVSFDQSEETKLVKTSCESISNRLASVSLDMCLSAKLRSTQCHSVNGFPILLSEFAPIEEKAPQGKVLLIGGTHGDELTSVSIVFRWIEKLNKYHSGLFHWHVVPMMNPDGVLIKEATRTNQNGIDLNRNLPSNDWHTNALEYWKTKTGEDPRRYPGEQPNSEPENQWLVDEINEFEPDVIISVHAPYGMVDFDSHFLDTAPKSLGRLHLNLLGTYPGSLGNYAGINRNIPVITLELEHAWDMPSIKESNKIWDDMVSWLKDNVNNQASNLTAE